MSYTRNKCQIGTSCIVHGNTMSHALVPIISELPSFRLLDQGSLAVDINESEPVQKHAQCSSFPSNNRHKRSIEIRRFMRCRDYKWLVPNANLDKKSVIYMLCSANLISYIYKGNRKQTPAALTNWLIMDLLMALNEVQSQIMRMNFTHKRSELIYSHARPSLNAVMPLCHTPASCADAWST